MPDRYAMRNSRNAAQSQADPTLKRAEGATPELVFALGAEGGSLRVFRVRTVNGDWGYTTTRNEVALEELCEGDEGYDPNDYYEESPLYPTFDACFAERVARYDLWPILHLGFCHHEFRETVRAQAFAYFIREIRRGREDFSDSLFFEKFFAWYRRDPSSDERWSDGWHHWD